MARWKEVHERLIDIRHEMAARDFELGGLLVKARDLGVARRFGMASVHEYADHTVGLTPRQTEERIRVAEALTSLPLLTAALAEGRLTFSAVRELSRIADRGTEREWIDAAHGKTVREVERLVSRRKQGDTPDSPPNDEAARHTLRFEGVSGETLALVREAFDMLRRDAAGQLAAVDDDALLREMARRLLGGPKDEGRSSYQEAVTVCERCQAGAVVGGGESVPISLDELETACCDAQHIGRVGPHVGATAPEPVQATQTIPPAVRREIVRRDKGCIVPGCRNRIWCDVHHFVPREEGGQHDPALLGLVCSGHHRAIHAGALSAEGDATKGFVFRHADGTPYGALLQASPTAVDAAKTAFAALRDHLHFPETRARRLVEMARAHLGPDADTAALVHQALVFS